MSGRRNSVSTSESESGSRRKRQKTENLVLLAKYDALRSTLRDHTALAHKGEATDLVMEHLNSLKQVYGVVQTESNRDTRVQLKDAEIFLDTSQFAATNAQNLKLGDLDVALNPLTFINTVSKYLNQYAEDLDGTELISPSEDKFNSFDWLKLGALYLQVSSKPILGDFLYGPLEAERKKPTTRSRNLDDTQSRVTSTAQNVQAQDITGDEEQNTAHMVKMVYRKFIENQDGEPINFFKFFINPNSFGQSVENLFFTSFLIKDSRLKLTVDESGIPFVTEVDPLEQRAGMNGSVSATNHHIATFDYRTWQSLVEKHNISEAFLGHRAESEPEDFDSDSDNE